MPKATTIPQYELKNKKGQAVTFDIVHWGGNQSYNSERAHRHHFFEMLVFENSGAQHEVDFKVYRTQKGSVHFVAPDNVHLLLRKPHNTGTSLLFTPDFLPIGLLNQLPFSKNDPTVQLNKVAYKELRRLVQQMETELESRLPFYDKVIQSHMQTLVLQLLRACENQRPKDEKSNLPQHVDLFLQLVKKHYGQHLTVEAYASQLHISAKHLIDLCKTHTGKTPLQLIKQQVVMEAKRKLYHTKLSIKEIAYGLNFTDPTNFTKYFKSVTGYSPQVYRDGLR